MALALLPVTAALTLTTINATGAETQPSSLQTSKSRVAYKGGLEVRGHFRRAQATTQTATPATSATGTEGSTSSQKKRFRVQIQFRPAGKNRWTTIRRTTSTDSGRFDGNFLVRESGHVRALALGGRRTPSRKVRVRSRTRSAVSRRNAVVGQPTLISGTVRPGGRRQVIVKAGDDRLRTRTNKKGRFSVRWRAPATGTYPVRVISRSNVTASGSRARAGKVRVFRYAYASWYGPGLYGNRTACGQTLTPSTMGVAHKTMPCGTKLTLRHNGNQVRVAVIDRGPYVHGREFDLTEATRNALGFGSTGNILSSK